jgi:redox-sensitive bicupin YhaK (pirin superfamily)
MLEFRKSVDRGTANLGWLFSRHTFSFGQYFDPQQVGFSDLRVINDDLVKPGAGFDTHPHSDMEIFSYVLEGTLEHRDSIGTGSVIQTGDVQIMSAGLGVAHSEFNHSTELPVHFLQVWILPDRKGVMPRYQQKHFAGSEKRGKFRLIISPDAGDGSLSIYQDVRVYAGLFDGDETAEFELPAGRHGYVHVACGSIKLNGITLEEGDGVRLRGENRLAFRDGSASEVLVFDLRHQELPEIQ